MCGPWGYAIAALASVAVSADSSRKARHAAEDQARAAESERKAADVNAVNSANAKLAADNRRRREQKSLLAQGAPQPTMGDTATEDAPLISPSRTLMSRSTSAARTTSLLARGAGEPITRPRTPTRPQAI